jgi:hypothetical protein
MLYENDGVSIYDKSKASVGYTIFWTLGTSTVKLMDMNGTIVNEWDMGGLPGNYGYLLPNGNMLAAIRTDQHVLGLAAKGGHIVEMDWDGNIVWEHIDHFQHHDFRRLENGNTCYIRWELMPEELAAKVPGGKAGEEHEDGIYGDGIQEIDADGNTVWEWHFATDIEDYSKYPICPIEHRKEWAHANTICPLPDGDYLISFRQNHLIARIDRKTKKFSWYMCDHKLGHQHDVQMLENGNILVYANGAHGPYHGPNEGSRIFEIDPKTDETVWEYVGSPPYTFDSPFISGCQPMPNGNILICEGRSGRLFEVTREGEIVWNFNSPHVSDTPPYAPGRSIFRCYRYAADSPEIAGRLGDPSWSK